MPPKTLPLILTLLSNNPLHAQITLDGTLGPSGTLPGPHVAIGAELGQQHGNNLFHSFHQFHLQSGESATFSGPPSISHIINRVTGGTPSQINGLLRSTIPQAHFYFINPAGILFGEQAQLDLQGSFHVSTANYIRLGDQGRFHATQPQNSLLTIAPPTAFGFIEPNQSSIEMQNNQLSVPENQTLSVITGDIHLTHSGLHAPSGTLNLVSVASAGEMSLDPTTIQLDSFDKLGKIHLFQSTLGNSVDSFNGSQNIYLRAGKFWSENSVLNGKVKNRIGEASRIAITSHDVVLQNNSVIATDSFNSTNAGHITLDTHTLTIHNNAILSSNTFQGGNAGMIKIRASQVLITDEAQLSSSTHYQGGSSGQIQITADTFQMRGNTRLEASSSSPAQSAGQIIITANQLQLADDATLDTTAFTEASGDGGQIHIETNNLIMTDRAWLISSSFTQGQSGSITIQTKTLTLSDQSAIVGATFSQGRGGNITLQVSDTFILSDAAVITSGTEGAGPGGNMTLVLQADKIAIADAANLSTAADIKNVVTIEIARILDLAKQLGSDVGDPILAGGGQPGNVFIQTDKFSLTHPAMPFLAAEQLLLTNCADPTADKGYFKSGRRKGLLEAFTHD